MNIQSLKPNLSPILIVFAVAFFLQIFISCITKIHLIDANYYLQIVLAIYATAFVVAAMMSQIDKWYTRYEQNRNSTYLQRLKIDETLYEAILKREVYQEYKKKYLKAEDCKALLVKMVAQLQAEFEGNIRAEAQEIVSKEKPVPDKPVDSFIQKNQAKPTSTERAAKIFPAKPKEENNENS